MAESGPTPTGRDGQEPIGGDGLVPDGREGPKPVEHDLPTEDEDRIAGPPGPGPGFVNRLPGMAYRCRNDAAWTMEFVSEGCRSLTGYDPRQIMGSGELAYVDIIHPEDRERVWDEIQRALAAADPSFVFQYRIVTAGNEVREVREWAHPLYERDGEFLGLEGFVTDVTGFEHAGRELANSEAMVRSLIHQGLAGVYVIQGGLFRFTNPAFAQIFGYRSEEIQDRLGPLDLTADEDREKVRSAIRRRLEEGESTVRYEVTGRRKDGGTVRLEVHGTMIELGHEKAIAGILIDITERRALEEQLRHAQRVEGLGELTGAIAHDFNNYLTAIIAPIEMALQDLDQEDPARSELLEARATARRAASLTGQLLSFGRKRVFSPRALDLNGVLEKMHGMLDRLAGGRVDVTYDLHPDLPAVEADPSHLQQVVVNLVVNARDAMRGGGRVVITTRAERVEPWHGQRWRDVAPGTYVFLSVRDHGRGIDGDTLAHIFDPYFTTKESGTGLGLSTVYGIVKQHGGELRVESTVGEGTEFTVLLPRSKRPPEREEEEDRADLLRSDVRDRRTATILLAEDEAAVRRVTVAALTRFGHTVLTAEDGAGALDAERAHQAPIDLLLTDLMLPDRTGLQLARIMRGRRPGLRVLLMSGYAPEEVLRDPGRGPEFPFLEKPFVIDELLGAVNRVLDEPAEGGGELAG